jgi:Big-like domain-containing protein
MRKLAGLFIALSALTCTDGEPAGPTPPAPRASISDAVHAGGNAHFYFLPPLVAAPQPTGQFDGSLLPYTLVEVCRLDATGCTPIASFSATSGSTCAPKGSTPPASSLLRVDPVAELYVVNWQTDSCFALDATVTYRIRVVVAGTELGHVDLDVVGTGGDLKDVNTQEYAGLVPGRTLPIKFRIEQGAVFPMGPDGGDVIAGDGRLVLRVPPGALPSFIGMTVQQADPADGGSDGLLPGTAWDLQPEGLSFLKPVELDLAYDPASMPDGIVDPAASLVVATLEDGNWLETVSTVDDDAHRVRGAIFGFSVKAVVLKTVSLDAAPSALIMLPLGGAQMVATPRDARGTVLTARRITYESSDPAVATVDASGAVKAVASGTAVIRIRPRILPLFPPGINPCDLPYAICAWPSPQVPVTVQAPVAAVEIVPSTATITVGDLLQLNAILKDDQGNELTGRTIDWSSVDPNVAAVSTTGLVSGITTGSTLITATSEGKSGSSLSNVVDRPYAFTPSNSGTTLSLLEVWGSADADVFATGGLKSVGDNAAPIIHFDGQAWSTQLLNTMEFRALSGSGSLGAYAGGGEFVTPCGQFSSGASIARLLHYDGTSWQPAAGFSPECNAGVRGLWVGSTSAVATGSGGDPLNRGPLSGRIWRLVGGVWERELVGDPLTSLQGVWGVSDDDIYAVGLAGLVMHFDGTSWTPIATGNDLNMESVWASSATDVFAVGASGRIIHFDGNGWTIQNSGTTENLGEVYGNSPTNVFAVGRNGTILHYDGHSWGLLASGTTATLAGVWVSPTGTVFVVGHGGTVLVGTRK